MNINWQHSEKQKVIHRLNRIEGQVRGVRRMIEEDRDCEEVIGQISALKSAINRTAMVLMAENLENCLTPAGTDAEDREKRVEKAKNMIIHFA